MLRALTVLALCTSLAACGQSRLNPFNWFGGEREERITVNETGRPADPRPLVAEVTSLAIEATTSGAILTATAMTERTGYWQPALIEVERAEGAIVYEFRAAPPPAGGTAGAAPTRQIVVATTLGRDDLEGLRSVTVIARENRRSVNRR
ncbi:hypothetical protein P6F26_03765 [Roseibacterium sp. SDUM158017]|uniref:hypothetical protein n=1 Tax=Roseicyclus salinarum TaxID=3036773 RepID=UPI00241501AB|nr:hypothetical protein [Roseibacterium sp. SDUM158017]MDG4647548.1 hypothetical protein [Roseibacterium sp. SDUM158017]